MNFLNPDMWSPRGLDIADTYLEKSQTRQVGGCYYAFAMLPCLTCIVHKTLWMYCMWQRMKSLRTEGKTLTLTIVQDHLLPINSSLCSATQHQVQI